MRNISDAYLGRFFLRRGTEWPWGSGWVDEASGVGERMIPLGFVDMAMVAVIVMPNAVVLCCVARGAGALSSEKSTERK